MTWLRLLTASNDRRQYRQTTPNLQAAYTVNVYVTAWYHNAMHRSCLSKRPASPACSEPWYRRASHVQQAAAADGR